MFEEPTESRLKSWRSTIAKILIVLFFPFAVNTYYGGFFWYSILFRWNTPIFTYFENAIMVLLSIAVMVPGIYLDRKIKTEPIEELIRKKGLGVLLITWVLPYGLSFNVVPQPATAFFFIPIVYLPIVSISFFIILPLLNREFIIRHTPTDLHNRSYSQLSNGFKKQFGSRRHLPLIIWTGLLFAPIVIVSGWEQIFESLFFQLFVSAMGPMLEFPSPIRLIYTIRPTSTVPFVFLLFSIRLLFLRDIIRFNDGNVTKSRLVSIGILAEIVPVAIITIMQFISYIIIGFPIAYFTPLLPTPLFPILGYVYVRMTRKLFMSNLLWDEEEHRMWFDPEKPSLSPGLPPVPPSIKVPITYIIRSKLRRQRSQ